MFLPKNLNPLTISKTVSARKIQPERAKITLPKSRNNTKSPKTRPFACARPEGAAKAQKSHHPCPPKNKSLMKLNQTHDKTTLFERFRKVYM
jgi:hypothetical protein